MSENEVYALDWDSEVSNDGGFEIIKPGIYTFRVKNLERERFDGSAKIPSCPRAKLTLEIMTNNGEKTVVDRLLLSSNLQWKIFNFFESLGFETEQNGKRKTPWNEIIGKEGCLELGIREYTDKDGNKRESNEVKKYIDQEEAFFRLEKQEQNKEQNGQTWSM